MFVVLQSWGLGSGPTLMLLLGIALVLTLYGGLVNIASLGITLVRVLQ